MRHADGRLVPAQTAGTDPAAIVVHDAHRDDPSLAFALSRLGDIGAGPVPLGIFREVVDTAPWGDGLVAAAREAHAGVGTDVLDALFAAGDTWTVA